jgi:hypothetical protein
MHFARNCAALLAASVVMAGTQAVAGSVPEFGPNPAVSWIKISPGFLPPTMGAGPVQQDPAHPLIGNDEFRTTGRQPTLPVADLTNAILQPWTRSELRKRNELVLSGKALSMGASCEEIGGAAFLIRSNVEPYFFIQAPDKVVIISQVDHQSRHIYLTDRHSQNVKPSWSGESIGHYEGDELVVDTIGISARAPVDKFFTPHSEQFHMIERFRLTSGGDRLDVRVHVEDHGAFTTPWNAVIQYRRVEPGRAENNVLPPSLVSAATEAGPLMELTCAENPFSYFGNDSPRVPQAERPDF